MQYREIRRTGQKASIIGLGTEHLDGKPYETVRETLDAARAAGINMMDVFMPGHDVRQKIGRALQGHREEFMIQGHIGSTDINQQYDISRELPVVKRYFEGLLKDLQTDHIDFGMLFFIDSERDFDLVFHSEIIRYAQELKRSGVIRGLGASSHNPVIARQMVQTGLLDLLMFAINPAFDMVPAEVDTLTYLEQDFDKSQMLEIDARRLDLYRTCEQAGVAITVMKTLAGGKLLSPVHTPFAQPLSVAQCIHYALTRPAVVSTLVGCQSSAQVAEAVAYLDAGPEERDYTAAIHQMNQDFKGSCVYCNHCLPCPAGIDIAAVTQYLDIARMDETAVRQGAGAHYRALSAHGSDCIKCGSCEEKCPFAVPVIENMARAAALFGR